MGSGVTAIVPSISPYVGKQFTNTAIERLVKIAQLDIVCFGLGRQDCCCNIPWVLKKSDFLPNSQNWGILNAWKVEEVACRAS